MSIRRYIIDYARGNDLYWFWRIYQLRKNIKKGFLYDILTFLLSRSAHRHGGYIGPDTIIKGTLSLPHGLHGIFLSRYAEIGENCCIYQNVTIGEVDRKAPVIGDNRLIGAGAVIVGNIKIGNHVKIGAGAVVSADIPDNCTVVSQPMRIIGKDTQFRAARAYELQRYDLMQTLIDYDYAEALNNQNIPVKVHIKIDTGMHRFGIPDEEHFTVQKIFSMKNLNICGMYTHLCCADSRLPEDIAFTKGQIDRFYRLINTLQKNEIEIPKLHIQSSYGLLNYPDTACDYVRAGIALYGVSAFPNQDTALKFDLRLVLSLKSRVILIRLVKKGDRVGYGRSFTAEYDSRIAIIPIGYGDGFPRNLSNGKSCALIKGHIVPVIGHICMDSLAVDITDAEDVKVGDIATLTGAEGYEELSAPVIADNAGSISNELLCRLGGRLIRW